MAASGSTFTPSTFGAALTWVQGEYGYLCNEVESFPTVALGFPGGQIVTNNGDRLSLLIVNLATVPVFLGLQANTPTSQGIILTANGGSLAINVRQDQTLPTRAFYAAASIAAQQVYVLEIIGWKKLPPGSIPGY